MVPRWVVVLSVGVVLSTCVPLAYHAANTPPDDFFVGNWAQVHDQSTYLMWARQVQHGRLLVYDLHTTEDHPPLLPSFPWLFIGLLGRFMPLLWAYHGMRVLWGLTYLLVAWGLVRHFLPDPTARTFAFIVIALGSGLGIVVDLINRVNGSPLFVSADVMPETWGFHSIAVVPHFALAIALMAGLAWMVMVGLERPSPGLAVAAGATAGLMILVHPFNIVVWGPLLAGHALACRLWGERRRLPFVHLAALAGMALAVSFLFWQIKTNPIFEAWSAQNVLPSPPMFSYMLGLGVPLVLAVSGLMVLRRRPRRTCADWLVIGWVAMAILAINSGPVFAFERRCIEGVHIAVALLAGIGMTEWLLPWLRRRFRLGEAPARRLALVLLLVCVLPTSMKILRDGCFLHRGAIPRDWVAPCEWLETGTPEDARVLTSRVIGNFAPVISGRRVYVGHMQQTIEFKRKALEVDAFFDTDTPVAKRVRLLAASGCGWVVAHDGERTATDALEMLEPAFRNTTVTVYRVLDST